MLTGITIRRAQASDASAIVALRDEAAAWLLDRGIRQWQPGEVSPGDVLGWLETGRVYVAELDGGLAGSVRLAWADVEVWGEHPPDAGYIQALVTARATAGRGLGARLLHHVEAVIARSGRPFARLSCSQGNAGLERFYAAAGYADVGSRSFDRPGWEPVTLLQKAMT